MLQAASLSALAGIRHAFFTRDGGVSDGIYASLNGGPGSDDAPARVAENRGRMAAALGVATGSPAHRLPDPFPRRRDHRPAMGAAGAPARGRDRDPDPGLAIGVTTADCGPVLLADATGRRHRRRPCRLARRRDRRAGSDHRRHGTLWGRPQPHGGGARADDPPAELRGRAGIRERSSRPTMARTNVFSSPRHGRTMPCSTCPAISPPASPPPASAGWRTSAIAPMPIRRGSSATAGRPTATSRTTGVTSMP